MKLLFVSDVPLNSPMSGAEQVLHWQAIGLNKSIGKVYAISRCNEAGFHVDHRNIHGVNEACYNANPEFYINFFLNLYTVPCKIYDQIQNGVPFSVAICHQPFTYFSLLLKNKLKNLPTVYVFHSPNHEEYLLSKNGKINFVHFIQVKIRRMIEKRCLQHAKKIIVLSDFMKSKVMSIHAIPEYQIEVNPGGVDLSTFQFATHRAKLKKQLNLSPGYIHLLTIRNHEPRMGLDNLVKALYFLKKKFDNIHLTIGGKGPEKSTIKKLVEEYGLNESIMMPGFIPSKLLPKYYGSADFFIIPTEHLEGFGLVTVESLSCGTPVLGTPVGGTIEILSALNKDFLFNGTSAEAIAEGIAKAIENYFINKGIYKKLRQQAHRYARDNFSWERHLTQLHSTILNLKAEQSVDKH